MTSLTMPQLHLGRGTHYAGITVFPVWTSATPIRGLATGAAASVEVGEMPDGPAVPWLELSNIGSRPALMLEGELLEGGWQSRARAGRDPRAAASPPGGGRLCGAGSLGRAGNGSLMRTVPVALA